MKIKEAFKKLKLKETEEGRAVLGYIRQMQEALLEAGVNEESIIVKAEEQIDQLEEELFLAEEKIGELFAGLFTAIRKRVVEPKGLELGKTSKEITQMTLETMDLYLREKVDIVEVEKLISEVEEDL